MNRRSILLGCLSAGAAAAMARASRASILLTGGGKPLGAGAAAAITSLTVIGSSTLIDQTNDYGDSTARTGVNGDGWVAKVVMPFLTATTFDPTKITLTLNDPGFDATGVVSGGRNRTVRGGKILRRQYTPGGAQSNNQESNTGGVDTVFFSLIGDNGEFATVYQGTTITAANAGSGFYGVAASGAIATKVNSSTRAYPKAGVAWLNRQHTVCGSGGLYVELVAMHKHAQAGQQVARVEFIATDAHSNTAATQTASAPVLSTLCTKGQPPEVYAATIPVTALTQSDLCIVNAKAYPWIGDSSAVLDLSVDGLNTTGTYATANPQTTLRFVNDKSGTFGGGHASVKAGVSGGTVQASEVASRATPFPTIDAAINALPAYNSTNFGRNFHDGSHIWLMDNGSGGAVAHTPSDLESTPPTQQKALTEIRKSPSNTANASVSLPAANVGVTWGLSWHVDITQSSGFGFRTFLSNASILEYYCDGTFTSAGTAAFNQEQLCGVLNLTQAGTGQPIDINGNGSVRSEVAAWIGYVCPIGGGSRVHAIVGSKLTNIQIGEFDPSSLVLHDNQDGKIVVNNLFLGNTGASRVGDSYAMSRGFFLGQNVFEAISAGTAQALSIGDLNSDVTLDNVVVTSNSVVGDRANLLYTNVSTKIKRTTSRFNLLKQRNSKTDLYTTDATTTGRTGSWAYIHGVDNWDVAMAGSGTGTVPAVGDWLGELWANTLYNVGVANVHFTTDNSKDGANTGGGTYSLTGSSNAAYNTVPSGFAPFKYDIAGVARKNDGTGAAGAYERTV